MRHLLRVSARTFFMPALTAAVLAASASTLSLAACGGATTQDVLDSKQSASSSGGGITDSGASGSSGTSGSSGSSGATDASVEASVGCPQETEPNNGKDNANTLAPTLCGAISPNSESDFLTFVLKPTSTTMKINFTGQVVLKVDVNGGNSVVLGGAGNVVVPFVKNGQYVVEVKATARGNSVPWRVDLIEK